MTGSDIERVIREINAQPPGQKGPYVTLLVVGLARDVAYYLVLGIVVWAVGRRMVAATLAAWKESRRVRA